MTRKAGSLAAAVGLLLVALLALSAGETSASTTSVGIDAVSSGSISLGTVQTCREVDVNETFDIDVWVQNVSDLLGWETRLSFDLSRLTPVGHEDQLFRPGSSVSVNEGLGKYFLGTVAFGGPVSGSGVLARVTFHASTSGLVQLQLLNTGLNPGTNPHPIDGGIQNASIAVGVSCAGVTPPPTQLPTPTPFPSPTLMPTASPTATTTNTPTPSATATPTLPPTPAPSPSAPTPTPVPPPLFDDPDCDNDYDEHDALRVILDLAGIVDSVVQCPGVGDPIVGGDVFGDLNCDGSISIADAMRVLAFEADLEPAPRACQNGLVLS